MPLGHGSVQAFRTLDRAHGINNNINVIVARRFSRGLSKILSLLLPPISSWVLGFELNLIPPNSQLVRIIHLFSLRDAALINVFLIWVRS